jgi:hypothetical protein
VSESNPVAVPKASRRDGSLASPRKLAGLRCSLDYAFVRSKDKLVDDTIFPVSNFNIDGLIRAM